MKRKMKAAIHGIERITLNMNLEVIKSVMWEISINFSRILDSIVFVRVILFFNSLQREYATLFDTGASKSGIPFEKLI